MRRGPRPAVVSDERAEAVERKSARTRSVEAWRRGNPPPALSPPGGTARWRGKACRARVARAGGGRRCGARGAARVKRSPADQLQGRRGLGCEPLPVIYGTNPPVPGRWHLLDDANDAGTRRSLLSLLAREFQGDTASASIALRLNRVCEAPLVELPKESRDDVHVLADVGGGHLVRVRVRRFREEPGPLRIEQNNHCTLLDGCDVRVWMEEAYDKLLEGPFLRARAKLRAEEAAAAAD